MMRCIYFDGTVIDFTVYIWENKLKSFLQSMGFQNIQIENRNTVPCIMAEK